MTAATARREIDLEDLSGLPATTAIDRLRARELRPAIEPVEVTDPADHGRVVDHMPHANAAVRRGQLITLLIGQANHPPDPAPSAGESQPDATGRLDATSSRTSQPLLPTLASSTPPPGRRPRSRPTPRPRGRLQSHPRPRRHPPTRPAHPPSRPGATRIPRDRPLPSPRHAERRGTRVWGGGGWSALAGAAVAVILAVAATLTPAGPGQPRRSPAPAARLVPSKPAAAPPPAPGTPRRTTAHSTRALSDKPGAQRRHPAPPQAPAATSQATSASTVSNSPRARPAVSPPSISARAERQSTPPPSPTGPLPGPYPNQP